MVMVPKMSGRWQTFANKLYWPSIVNDKRLEGKTATFAYFPPKHLQHFAINNLVFDTMLIVK